MVVSWYLLKASSKSTVDCHLSKLFAQGQMGRGKRSGFHLSMLDGISIILDYIYALLPLAVSDGLFSFQGFCFAWCIMSLRRFWDSHGHCINF